MKYLVILLLFVSQSFVYSQTCNLTISTTSPTAVCPGTVVNLSGVGSVFASNSSFNFNAGTLPTGWSVTGGASFGTPCGAGPGGDYFWASTAGSGVPYIQTAGFDVCSGGNIVFDMRYAVQAGSTPCEGPDEPDEGVSIEYSLDGGATWVEFVYFHPNGTTLAANPGGNTPTVSGATPWTTWSTITVPIPAGAISGNTIFRWVQTNSSGTCCDNWGIDNVFINAGPCLTANINWSTGENGVNNISPTIVSDSCITADLYDNGGNFLCSAAAPICYTVNPINTIAAGTNRTVCANSAMTNITLATTGATGATFSGLPAGVTGSWAGNTVTISGTPTVAGTYNYTVTTTGGCPPATTTGTITVTPPNTIAAGTNQTVCVNSAITNISLPTTGATGATFAGLPAGVTGSWAGNVATISGTPTVAGTYNYTVTTTGGCPPATTTGTITVTPLNTIAAGTNQTVCVNSAITNITLATTGATGATFAGLPPGVSGSWAGNVATISGTPTVAGTYNYTVTTTGGCPPATTTGTITVNPFQSIAPGTNQTVCINSALTNITLATVGATGATFAGLPPGVTGTWAANTATISGTPTASGTFNYTVTTTGGCSVFTTGTITVTPLNTIAAGSNQTVCINSALTNITMATTGATGATFSGLPAGVTGSWAGNVATISGTPTASGTFNYTVTTTGGCPPATATGTITVNPQNTIAAGSNQTVCINSALTNITMATTGATGATFAGLPAGVTGSWAGNVATISGIPTASGTFNYTVTTTGGCPPATTTGTITVTPLNTIAAGTNQTVCINSAITNITLATTGATGATFAGLPAGVTGSWAGDVATISGTPTASGTFNYTVTTTGGCPPATTTGTITVTPLNTIAAGTNQTVCLNSAITNITLATTGATGATITGLPAGVTGSWAGNVVTISGTPSVAGTYNYTVTTTGGCPPATTTGTITVTPLNTIAAGSNQTVCINSAITNITMATTGATGATFAGLPAGVTGSWAGNVATISGTPTASGTFNYTVTTTGGCPPATTTGTITVTPLNTIAAGTNQTVCINSAITNITLATTGATGATFAGLPAGVTGSWAGNVATISGTPSVAGTFNYTVTTTGGCPPATTTGTITVTPLNTIAAGTNQTVCATTAITNITLATTGATGATFAGLPAGVTGSWAGNVVTISGTPTVPGVYNYTVTTTGGCPPATTTGTITVNPLPTGTTSGTTDVCQNGAAPNITFTGSSGIAPYTFTYTINGGAPQTVTTVGASSTVTVSVPTGTPGTYVYALTGVQDASSTTCSNPQTDSETITVNPLPTASTIGTTDVCQNGVSPNITFTGANGTAPYTFTYTINGVGPYYVSSVGASSTATVSVPTGTVGTFTYALINVQDASSTTCSNPQADSEIVTVNPLPTASTSGTIAVCQNATSPDITFTGANGTAPYTFTYTINGGAPLTVSSVGASSTATVSVPTAVAGTFTYALTGVQDASSTTCSNPQVDSETVTVNPLPTASTSGTTDVCQNGASPNITFTGANGTAPYTFTYTINGGAPQTVSSVGASSTATVSVPTGTVGTFTYALTGVQDASSTTCSNPQVDSEVITVNPLPTASTSGTTDVCQNGVSPNITFTGANGTAPYTFTYTINGGAPQTVSSVGASSTATVSVPTGTAGTFTYALTGVQDASSTTCSNPQVDSETVIVNPLPTASTSGTIDVCQNDASPDITFTGANGTAPYTFTYTINGGAPLTVTTVGASNSVTVSVPTATAGTFVYALTGVQDASSTTCSNPQVDSETVIVNPLPTASTSGTIDVCQNGAAPNITFTGANGTAPYTFTYTINGVGPYYVSSVGASSTATVSVPTGTAGTFTYALTGVQDASSTTCSNPQVDSETVTVNPLPTGTTSGTIAVCQNDAAPDITFTGANGVAPYTFTYTINGGAPLTVSSVGASSTATVSVPTAVAGTFTYALTGVQDASSTTCSNPQVDSETVTVNPLPTASTSGTTDVCQNGAAPNITFTGANGTAPYTFTYTINGGAPQTVSSVGASTTATVSVPTGTPGTYTYALTGVQDASSTTCSNPQVDSEIVTVNPLPTASTSGSIDVCQNGTPPNITFTGANGTAPYTFTYTINGGAPQTVSSVGASPTATVSVPTGTAGTFVYALTGVQDASSTTCYNPQSDSETVLVNPLSAASTSGSTAACQNGASPVITFTGFNGTAPYTFTYTINGGAPLTVSSVGASTTATVSVPTGTAGTFVYDLISVMDASSTSCSNPQVDSEIITINPLPTGTTSGTIDVCQNATSPVITFTGANGTAPYTFSYTINNGVTMYVSSVGASNTATVSVPTGTAGTYVYALTGVQDASSTTCSNPQVDSETVIVNPLPTASTSGTTAVCQDATAPVVTFTGANGTAPYTFTYTINGGAPLTVSTTGGSSSATVTVPTNVPGTFVFDLVSVQDASSTSCLNPQVDSETITVNPLPTATIAGSIDVCHNDVFPDITLTGANGTAPYTFTYTINGGAPQTVSSSGANNSVTVPVPTGTPGTYVYELTGVQDGSSTTCSNAQTGTVTVNVYAYPPIDAGVDQLICENSSTTVNATNPMGVPFYWDNGVIDGVPFSPSQSTTYTVTADNHGCLSTDDVYIEVEPLPTVIFSGDTLQGCEPVVVNFTSSSSSPFGVASCVWDFGDGNQYVGCGGASNTFEDPGYYSVTLTVTSNNGCVNSATYADYVYVEAYPIVEFSPAYAHITTLSTIVNYENNTVGGSTYVWNFGDGTTESTQVHPTHTFPDETSENFTVRLIATSPIGCIDTAYGYVDVKEELIYYIPNTFTPDGDDFNETFMPVFTDGFDPYSYTMLIFNRWGEVIWESHDTQVGWDGNYGGIPVQDGTYTWKIDFKTSYDDERIMDTGHVNVIRGGTTK